MNSLTKTKTKLGTTIPPPETRATLIKPTFTPQNEIVQADCLAGLRKIPGESHFDVIIIDPPYNIGKDFGNNQTQLPIAQYVEWALAWVKEAQRLIKPECPIFLYGYPEILARLTVHVPIEQQRWLVWHYTNKTVPTSKFWQRSFENIVVLWKGKKPILNVDAIREPYTPAYLKCKGKIRKDTACRYSHKGVLTSYQVHEKGALPRDVIKVSALAGGKGGRERYAYCKDCESLLHPRELKNHSRCTVIKHPTQKPLELTRRLLLSACPPLLDSHSKTDSQRDSKLLIPFAGSGSECVVAEELGFRYLAFELNADYVKLGRAWVEKFRL